MKLVTVNCAHCNKPVEKQPRHVNYANKVGKLIYCDKECYFTAKTKVVTVQCTRCGIDVEKDAKEIKNSTSGRFFCTQSCAASYNNLHKTKGNRRSKLEVWLEEQLAMLYPGLYILYCDKQAINGELDIYVPSLRLAFELNGIYHYEPIHGQPKLDQVQSNDHRKFQACIEHGIELVIMDTSQLKYFKPINCQKYLDIIAGIIDCKLLLADPGWVVSK